MKTHKKFYVIAYDICDDARRRRVVKKLEALGKRVNFSVFECMLTKQQFSQLQADMQKVINPREDTLVYYPLCLNCYAKVEYQPKRNDVYETIKVV